MARNWAIVIGINDYNPNNFTPLRYAKRDAELVRDFFVREARFEQVYFFSDDAPSIKVSQGVEYHSYPSYGNLSSFLQDLCAKPRLQLGDNFWFFFAGHGERYGDRDYLMPIDANSRGDKFITALPVSDVRELLCRSGADNVILILDACRNQGSRGGNGIGTEVQQGVITISSCSPTQCSWEIDQLRQGAFTYALLEALRRSGRDNCATVERLDEYLKYRVPELCNRYQKVPVQLPRISVDPLEKRHFILLPLYARDIDITTLKNDAYRAEANQKWDLARQLWIRISATTLGQDTEVFEALERIARGREVSPERSQPQSPGMPQSTRQSPSSTATSPHPQQPCKGRVGEKLFNLQKVFQFGFSNPPLDDVRSAFPPPALDEDDLSSAKGIDYTRLRNLLKAQKWKKANQETYVVMIEAGRQGPWNQLTSDEIRNFSCLDLETINSLWAKYSNGHFCFSVQKQIFLECSAKLNASIPIYEIYKEFGDRVGWRKDGKWLNYDDLKPSPSSPKGNFPWGGLSWWDGNGEGWFRWGPQTFFSRIETCGL